MHYGKYASLYLRRTFFFDANPPLGKMLVASAAYLAGGGGGVEPTEGFFSYDKIGLAYPESVPLAAMRLVPALAGAALTPAVYLVLCELGASNAAGALAGLLVVLGETAI